MEKQEEDIKKIIDMLDSSMEKGVGRVKVHMEEGEPKMEVKQTYGRCDASDPAASGCDVIIPFPEQDD